MKLSHIALFGAAAFMLGFSSLGAEAGCYENVGCTDQDRFSNADLRGLSCQNLFFLRNSIYAENGYCFRKAEYRALFANRNCRFDSSGDVPLNRTERGNVLAIVAIEREKGCRS